MTSPLQRTRVASTHDAAEWKAIQELIDSDPVANCFVGARLERFRDDNFAPASWRIGGEIWIHDDGNGISSLCYSGANLVPVNATSDVDAFITYAKRRGRRCSSIVGPADAVLPIWDGLQSSWGPAREVRANQPLMTTTELSQVEEDPLVHALEPVDLDLLMPAAVAMFTEELGISPLGSDGGVTYRARVAELLNSGRAFGRIDQIDGSKRVTFKADIGAMTSHVSQIQGVWVDPSLRGQGRGIAGMAAVVRLALANTPTVSLYVNDYNHTAIHCYERVGFTRQGTFASILF